MTGAAAAVVFPTLKELDPSLPEYTAYTGEHWRIAAGQVASRVFRFSDGVQLGCAAIAVLSLAAGLVPRSPSDRRFSLKARVAFLIGAIAVLTCQRFFLAPRMNADMLAYWGAARAGDNERAAEFRAAFDAAHPLATRLLVAQALCVLGALVTGAWSAAARERPPAGPPLPTEGVV